MVVGYGACCIIKVSIIKQFCHWAGHELAIGPLAAPWGRDKTYGTTMSSMDGGLHYSSDGSTLASAQVLMVAVLMSALD